MKRTTGVALTAAAAVLWIGRPSAAAFAQDTMDVRITDGVPEVRLDVRRDPKELDHQQRREKHLQDSLMRISIHREKQLQDSLMRIHIQVGSLDSLLKNTPKTIEIDGTAIRTLSDSIRRYFRSPRPPAFKRTEIQRIVKFGEDVVVGRHEVVMGDVVVIDGDATIYGEVEGGVVAIKGNIRLTSTGWVENDLVCIGGNTDVDPGAHAGGTNVFNFEKVWNRAFGHPILPSFFFVLRLVRTVLLVALAVLIITAFPEPTRRVRRYLEKGYARSLAAGLIALFLLPFLFIVLMITVLGIPIAVLLLPLAVLGAFLLGIASFGLLAGEWLLQKFNAKTRSPALAVTVGILLFEAPQLLKKPISYLGSFFSLSLLLVGIAVFLFIWTPAFGGAVVTRFGRAPKGQAK